MKYITDNAVGYYWDNADYEEQLKILKAAHYAAPLEKVSALDYRWAGLRVSSRKRIRESIIRRWENERTAKNRQPPKEIS
jgi:hypothetical protein